MNDIREIQIETFEGTQTHVIIDRGNGEFTSMPKEVYDAMQEAQQNLGGIH